MKKDKKKSDKKCEKCGGTKPPCFSETDSKICPRCKLKFSIKDVLFY